jgi:hypothetical protein
MRTARMQHAVRELAAEVQQREPAFAALGFG